MFYGSVASRLKKNRKPSYVRKVHTSEEFEKEFGPHTPGSRRATDEYISAQKRRQRASPGLESTRAEIEEVDAHTHQHKLGFIRKKAYAKRKREEEALNKKLRAARKRKAVADEYLSQYE